MVDDMAPGAIRVVLTGPGDPEVLRVEAGPLPVPGRGEVLIRMEAAGVAFNDITTRQGRNPGKLPLVLGFDVVGVVHAVGPEVTGFRPGQRVAAMVGTGGYASHVVARSERVVPIPPHLDPARVSALVLNYFTAWQMLHRVADVKAGQSILVLGAAGGVGSALVELAHLVDVRVYGTASARRHQALEDRGVRVVADQAAVPELVDVTFDPVGGPSLARSRKATRRTGLVVSFGFSFTVDGGHGRALGLLRTIASLAWAKTLPGSRTTVYTVESSVARHPARFQEDLSRLIDLLAAGTIQPKVETMPLVRAAEAHRRLEGRQVAGKLVLVP